MKICLSKQNKPIILDLRYWLTSVKKKKLSHTHHHRWNRNGKLLLKWWLLQHRGLYHHPYCESHSSIGDVYNGYGWNPLLGPLGGWWTHWRTSPAEMGRDGAEVPTLNDKKGWLLKIALLLGKPEKYSIPHLILWNTDKKHQWQIWNDIQTKSIVMFHTFL